MNLSINYNDYEDLILDYKNLFQMMLMLKFMSISGENSIQTPVFLTPDSIKSVIHL